MKTRESYSVIENAGTISILRCVFLCFVLNAVTGWPMMARLQSCGAVNNANMAFADSHGAGVCMCGCIYVVQQVVHSGSASLCFTLQHRGRFEGLESASSLHTSHTLLAKSVRLCGAWIVGDDEWCVVRLVVWEGGIERILLSQRWNASSVPDFCVPLKMNRIYLWVYIEGNKRDFAPLPKPLSSPQDQSLPLLLPLPTHVIRLMVTPPPPPDRCSFSRTPLHRVFHPCPNSLSHTRSLSLPLSLSSLPRQPPSSPLLYRTAWHVPHFPNDLLLKVCLHESDRTNVKPTLAALDSRGCYLLVVPATTGGGGRAKATANIGVIPSRVRGFAPTCSSTRQIRTGGFGLPTPPSRTPKATGKRGGSFESPLPPAAAAAAAARPHALSHATRSVSLSRLSTPSPAAARARAAAAAAVIANAKAVAAVAAAKEAQAVAAAAAAEEAVMVAKAVEAGVSVPWTWRESEVSARGAPKARLWTETSPLRVKRMTTTTTASAVGASAGRILPEAAAIRPSSAPEVSLRPAAAGGGAGGGEEEGGVQVYVWKGAQSNGECRIRARGGGGTFFFFVVCFVVFL